MTEQEIIEYLKKNKETGIAFVFMPKEVKDWCSNRHNYFNDFLLYKNGAWRDEYCFVNPSKDLKEMALEEIFILALPDSFQIKKESKGGWVEFEITDKGLFFLEYTDRGGSNVSHRFYWHQWSQFLEYCDIDELKYTAFGGWQYKACDAWYIVPQMFLDDHYIDRAFKGEENIKPAIPIKIRFWRENK